MINFNSKAVQQLSKVVFAFFFLVQAYEVKAQSPDFYNQTSELAPTIIRYNQDVRTLLDFYSPRAPRGYSYQPVLNSPVQRKRLVERIVGR